MHADRRVAHVTATGRTGAAPKLSSMRVLNAGALPVRIFLKIRK